MIATLRIDTLHSRLIPGAASNYASGALLSLNSPPILRRFGALPARMPRARALAAALALATATAASPLLRRAGSANDDGGATPLAELMSHDEVMALHANFTRARELQGAPAGTVLTVGACTHSVPLRCVDR